MEETIEEAWVKVKRFLILFLIFIFGAWILILVLWNVIVDLGVENLEHGLVNLVLIIPVLVVVFSVAFWVLIDFKNLDVR